MVIMMKAGSAQQDIDYVIRRANSLGLETHVSKQNGRTLIGLLGDLRGLDLQAFGGLRGVERVSEMTRPFRLASREFKSEPTVVQVRDCPVGTERVVIAAGPCSVENLGTLQEISASVASAGGSLLRGGAFKPRTSPYSFSGLGEAGLEMLAEVRSQTGLPVVTEVLSSEQVPLVSRYADLLQIGARNMQNFALLHAVGELGMPVLLKRGMMSTVEELLLSAEYILSHGNADVILCERGIRTFETYTRNTLDISAIPALKELTHLPVIVDPSHATGRASLVSAVSKAAIAAGADGLLIEVHPDPEFAVSDGFQCLTLQSFSQLVGELKPIAEAIGRSI